MSDTTVLTGKVKWFDARRGYGFIVDEEGFDYFVHYSEIEGNGFRHLRSNEVVRFEPAEDAKCRKVAKSVEVIAHEDDWIAE